MFCLLQAFQGAHRAQLTPICCPIIGAPQQLCADQVRRPAGSGGACGARVEAAHQRISPSVARSYASAPAGLCTQLRQQQQ